MKYILFILLVGGIVGCGVRDDTGKVVNYGLYTKTHNGCQYVIYNDYQAGGVTHAGNCNNPVHSPIKP